MAGKKLVDWNEYLDAPFKGLAKEVAPNERALSGDLGDEILSESLGKKHVKKLPGPKPPRKGLLDL